VVVVLTFGGEQIVRVLIGNSPLPGATLKSANHVRVIMEIVGQSFGLPIKVPPTPLCSLNCPGVRSRCVSALCHV
jgi:hypothetical protein